MVTFWKQTLVEILLKETFRPLLECLKKISCQQLASGFKEGFVFIAASDVLESFHLLSSETFLKCLTLQCQSPVQCLLVAHESPLDIAEMHGVYVLDDEQRLKLVLQKPSISQLGVSKAVLESGLVLTDSSFLLGSSITKRLIELRRNNGDEINYILKSSCVKSNSKKIN